jgi:hypothetical protein
MPAAGEEGMAAAARGANAKPSASGKNVHFRMTRLLLWAVDVPMGAPSGAATQKLGPPRRCARVGMVLRALERSLHAYNEEAGRLRRGRGTVDLMRHSMQPRQVAGKHDPCYARGTRTEGVWPQAPCSKAGRGQPAVVL